MREKDLRWERTNAISYDPELDSGKRFCFDQHWHYVHIDLVEYDMMRSHRALEAEFGLRDHEGGDWTKRTDQGQKLYRDKVHAAIKPIVPSTACAIYGRGRIERDSIHVVSVLDPDRPSKDEPVNVAFQDMEVGIRSSGEQTTTGSIFFDRQNARHPKLHLEVYLAEKELLALIEDIRSSTIRPTLRVSIQALLFQDEVDSSLREHYHRQELMIPEAPGATLAILNTIRFAYDKTAVIAEVYDDPADAPKAAQVPAMPMNLQVPAELLRLAKGVKGALYSLAAAVLVAGFMIGR